MVFVGVIEKGETSEYKLHVFQASGLPAIQGPPIVHVVQFSQNPHKLTVVQCYSAP